MRGFQVDSVHSMDGVFLMSRPGKNLNGLKIEGANLQDMGATLLTLLGVDPKVEGFPGTVLEEVVKNA